MAHGKKKPGRADQAAPQAGAGAALPHEPTPPPRAGAGRAVAGAVAAAAGLIYLTTAAPGAWWGDGQELACAAWTLGIPHPTGYPLYTVLGHLWLKGLAHLDPGRALTLFNVVCQAVAAGLLFRLFQQTLVRDPANPADQRARAGVMAALPAAGAALIVALSRTVWEQATFAEVYALNYVLAAGLLLAVWADGAPRGPRHAAAAGVMLGLMGLNHYSCVAFAPLAALVLLRWGRGAGQPWRIPLAGVAGFVIPLAGYLYLPLRARANPPLNWGDPSSLRNLIWVLSGGQFRELRMGADQGSAAGGLLGWIGWWGYQLAPGAYATPGVCLVVGLIVLAVAIGGLILLARARWELGAGLLATLALTAGFGMFYQIPDIDAYFLPAAPAAALGWIVSVRWALAALGRRWGELPLGPLSRAVPVLVAGAMLLWHYPRLNKSWDDAPAVWGEAVMNALPDGAVVLTGGDADTYCLWYQQMVLGRRKDVSIVGSNFIFSGWYARYFEAEGRPRIPVAIRDQAPGHKLTFDVALFEGTILPNLAAGRPLFATFADPLFAEYLRAEPVETLLPASYYEQSLYPAPFLPTPVLYRLHDNAPLRALSGAALAREFERWYRRPPGSAPVPRPPR